MTTVRRRDSLAVSLTAVPCSRWARRLMVSLLAAGVASVATASPAAAHGSGPGPTNYRSTLIAVEPTLPGVSLRVLEAGRVIELTNRSTTDIVVLGYQNEPYLRVGPGGVFENRRAPSLYRNATPERVPPPSASVDAEPDWRRRSDSSTVRWHDHRSHGGVGIGGSVESMPWTLRFLSEDRLVVATGVRRYVPGPNPVPYLGAAAAIAAAIATVVLRRRRSWAGVLSVALGVAVGLDVARALGGFAARPGDTLLNRLFDQFFYSGTAWLIAGLAIARLARRPADLPLSVAFCGIFLFVLGGIGELAVLWSSQLVFAYPPWLARMAATAALGVGAGALIPFVRDLTRPLPNAPAAASTS